MLKRMLLCVLIAGMGWPAAAGEALTARVRPSVGIAPSDVVIQVFIEPNELNRSVTYVIDSDTFYSSSMTELNGERAPRERDVTFRMVPAGAYQVRVTLNGTKGERGHFEAYIELS
jgi:hypothetical protein